MMYTRNPIYGFCIYLSTMSFRVGLMGNPSDGFHGKTISLTIANFWAEVTIKESDKLVCMKSKSTVWWPIVLLASIASVWCRQHQLCIGGSWFDNWAKTKDALYSLLCLLLLQVLVPHPLNDPTEFGSLGDLHGISLKEGYVSPQYLF